MMTVGGWIFCLIIIICLLATGAYVQYSTKKWIGLIVSVVLSIGCFGTFYWYYHGTESGKRAMKSQESNFNGGIKRSVRVFDVNGDLIQEYAGEFDVDYDSNRIVFDDENGLRHIIYYPTGTVIIDEIQ